MCFLLGIGYCWDAGRRKTGLQEEKDLPENKKNCSHVLVVYVSDNNTPSVVSSSSA